MQKYNIGGIPIPWVCTAYLAHPEYMPPISIYILCPDDGQGNGPGNYSEIQHVKSKFSCEIL
jgi:hypothetical protein